MMHADHLFLHVHIPERKIMKTHVREKNQILCLKLIFMIGRYLMISFNRFWEGMMDYKANIWLVNP